MKRTFLMAIVAIGALILVAPAIADYSNIMEAGSSFSGTSFSGSMGYLTGASGRITGDAGVGSEYNSQITSAIGNANSYIRGSLMEGRGNGSLPSSTINFFQSTSARGQIFKFTANYRYTSSSGMAMF
ncbi:MAG: hypothetical protein WC502_04010 [Methanolinea sp.]|jgi:hypothetical protein